MKKPTYSEIQRHNPLKLSPSDDDKHWVLLKSFSYDVGSVGSGDVIKVPKLFVTDFASTPRLVWFVFPRWGKYGKAAIVHDYIYATGERKNRREADKIFLEIMKVSCVDWLSRYMIWFFVRVFGRFWYKPNKKQVEEHIAAAHKHKEETTFINDCKPKLIDVWRTLYRSAALLFSWFSIGFVVCSWFGYVSLLLTVGLIVFGLVIWWVLSRR
jgi:hypothetical protein